MELVDPSAGVVASQGALLWDVLLLAVNLVLALAAFLGAFVLKHVWTSLIELRVADDRLAERVAGVRSSVEENFVRTSALRDALDPLREHLTRIEGKLDRKVDRSECGMIHRSSSSQFPVAVRGQPPVDDL